MRDELVEALRPFAEHAERFSHLDDDVTVSITVTVAQLRKAEAAVRERDDITP